MILDLWLISEESGKLLHIMTVTKVVTRIQGSALQDFVFTLEHVWLHGNLEPRNRWRFHLRRQNILPLVKFVWRLFLWSKYWNFWRLMWIIQSQFTVITWEQYFWHTTRRIVNGLSTCIFVRTTYVKTYKTAWLKLSLWNRKRTRPMHILRMFQGSYTNVMRWRIWDNQNKK